MFDHYISSAKPVYVIVTLDQSSRMAEPYNDGISKGMHQFLLVNKFLNELIFRNAAGDKIKDRFFISIIGHSNDKANEIRSGYLSSFADCPLRIEKVKKKVSDGAGGLVEIEDEVAIYVDGIFKGGENQLEVFKLTQNKIKDWIEQRGYCSTLIVNISGGYTADWKETTIWINDMKVMVNNSDRLFFFNLLLDSNNRKILFPTLEEVAQVSFTNLLYYEWSSYFNFPIEPKTRLHNKVVDNLSDLEICVKDLNAKKMFSNFHLLEILNFIYLGS
jgi:hypothetical protein